MYDDLIKQAVSEYLPGVDWRFLKAQYIQESGLNPAARSPVGAMGIAQFMPGTWDQVAAQLQYPTTAHPTMPNYAIPAGAFYMRTLIDAWSWPRADIDRHCLAMASYNAGLGNIVKAQRAAGNPSDYKSIIQALPQITGRHAGETTQYVKRILDIYMRMVTG